MGTPTKLYLNWSAVGVTPSGGSALTLTNVTNVDPDLDCDQEAFFGDARAFCIAIANTKQQRTMTISGGDVYKLFQIPMNTPCTIVATLNDLNNGSGSGALTFTLANAVRKGLGVNAPNNKIGLGSMTFMAFSVDGTTDPLSIAQAP